MQVTREPDISLGAKFCDYTCEHHLGRTSMTVKSSLAFILLFASSSVFAAEDFNSGNFMLRYCKNLVDGK
jgi:hypothetical protein